jgi:hypothetical protein
VLISCCGEQGKMQEKWKYENERMLCNFYFYESGYCFYFGKNIFFKKISINAAINLWYQQRYFIASLVPPEADFVHLLSIN